MLLQLPYLLCLYSVLRLRVLRLGPRCVLGLLLALLHRLLLLLLAVGLKVGMVLLERLMLRELGVRHLGAWQHGVLRQLGARLLRGVAWQGLVTCRGDARGAPGIQIMPRGAVHGGQAWQGLLQAHHARLQGEDKRAEHPCVALSACQQGVHPGHAWQRLVQATRLTCRGDEMWCTMMCSFDCVPALQTCSGRHKSL